MFTLARVMAVHSSLMNDPLINIHSTQSKYRCVITLSFSSLPSDLRTLSEKQKVPVDLDTYIKKLANSRKRIMLVNDILQNVQVIDSIYNTGIYTESLAVLLSRHLYSSPYGVILDIHCIL